MDVPFTTIGTVVGVGLARGIATASASGSAAGSTRGSEIAGTLTAVGTAIAAGAAGYYLGGMKRPNTFARGLLWSGGFGLLFGIPSMVGLAFAPSTPERQPAKIGGPLDTDLVESVLASMRR